MLNPLEMKTLSALLTISRKTEIVLSRSTLFQFEIQFVSNILGMVVPRNNFLLLRILTGKKAPLNKTPAIRKVRIWAFGLLVH